MRRRWRSSASTARTCDVMLFTLQPIAARRRVASCGNFEEPRVSWSADGEWLVESFAPGPDPIRGWQIARVSTATGVREDLDAADAGHARRSIRRRSRRTARASPSCAASTAPPPIFTSSRSSGGTPTRVTWDNQDLVGVDWSADGRRSSTPPIAPAATPSGASGIDGGDAAVGRRRRRETEASVGGAQQRPHHLRELGRTRSISGKRRSPTVSISKAISRRRFVRPCRPPISGTTRPISRLTRRSSRLSRRDRAARNCGWPIVTARTRGSSRPSAAPRCASRDGRRTGRRS